MKRRDFLKLSGGLGLGAMLPGRVRANQGPLGSVPLLVTVQASGGWDVTMICDPKGHDVKEINRDFTFSQTVPFGSHGLRVAPYDFNTDFFDTYLSDMTVLNGVNTRVASHVLGQKTSWTGKSTASYPSLAALYAAVHGPTLPLSYFSTGGFDGASGLLPVARLPNPSQLSDVVDPVSHFSSVDLSRIRTALNHRYGSLVAGGGSSSKLRRQEAMALAMQEAHLQADGLEALKGLSYPYGTGSNAQKRQAYMILKAYQAGLLTSANIMLPNFDTHGDNDVQQKERISTLFETVHYLMTHAASLINNDIIVVIGSDFGRTNGYNNDDGKEPWNIGSYIILNPQQSDPFFTGSGTVHGVTTPTHTIPSGMTAMTTADVHIELRRFLGLNGWQSAPYPLS